MPANRLSRRDFLKGAGSAAAMLALGCAPTKEELMASVKSMPQVSAAPPVVYPRLPYKKVQAPETGCMVGFHNAHGLKVPAHLREQSKAAKSIDDLTKAFDKPEIESMLGGIIEEAADSYKGALGKHPAIFVLRSTSKLYYGFPFN